MVDAKALGGSAIEVKPTDRITSIAGEPVELYITAVAPCPVGGIRPSLHRGEKVVIESLTYSGGILSAGVENNFKAIVEFIKSREHSDKRSPDGPDTKGYLVLKSANQKKVSKLLELKFADALTGKAFANTHAFALVTVVYTDADPDGGDPGSASPTLTPIQYMDIDLSDQYEGEGASYQKLGDAMLILDKELVSKTQLESADYFTLTPQGGTAIQYTLWNDEGIKDLKTHHWKVYLQRMKQ